VDLKPKKKKERKKERKKGKKKQNNKKDTWGGVTALQRTFPGGSASLALMR